MQEKKKEAQYGALERGCERCSNGSNSMQRRMINSWKKQTDKAGTTATTYRGGRERGGRGAAAVAAGRPFPSPGVAERDNRVLSDSLCYYLALTICILIKKSYSEFVVDEKSAGALLVACTQVKGRRGEGCDVYAITRERFT